MKAGRHTERIVVSRIEDGLWFDQINADQQPATLAGKPRLLKKGDGFVRREIADTRAGIKQHARAAADFFRQLKRAGKIAADTGDIHLRVTKLQVIEGGNQKVDRDIDRHITRRLECRKKTGGLGTVAGAEINQRATGADGAGDFSSVRLENAGFGACRVILIEFGYRLEQARTKRVVEKLGGDVR